MPEKNLIVNSGDYAPMVPPDLTAFQKTQHIVYKSYLSEIDRLPVNPCPAAIADAKVESKVCLFPIQRVVYDRTENNVKKLGSVYSGASSVSANLLMLVDGSQTNARMYLGCSDADRVRANEQAKVLYRNFTGNFPGCRVGAVQGDPILSQEVTAAAVARCIPSDGSYRALCAVSGIASLREQEEKDNEAFIQGIEKVAEAMSGCRYAAIIRADALNSGDIREMIEELEMLYTQLAPFAKCSLSISHSDADAYSQTMNNSLSDSVNSSTSRSLSVGTSTSHTHSKGSGSNIGGSIGGDVKLPLVGGCNTNVSFGRFENTSDADTTGTNNTRVIGEQDGTGHTVTVTTGDGQTVTFTQGQTVQLTYDNKTVQDILARIDSQLKRLRQAEGTGMFAVAAYFLAPTLPDAKAAASTYKAIITGKDTSLESATINSWTSEGQLQEILPYLRMLRHPEFLLEKKTVVTPASVVTASELAIHMGLPKSKIPGIPVKTSISFGRNVLRQDGEAFSGESLPLGETYHLGRGDGNEVPLQIASLPMHLLITGTTGAGKSNTIYTLLQYLRKHSGIPFLVIEPVKGDYKKDLAHWEDVHVYGTNPEKTDLLRLDPFYFPEDTHVLEHLERLIDLFNVCWPMYAAMPAVLKDACQRAYEAAGWNLRTSRNRYGVRIFPKFEDVAHMVEEVMNESKYSNDNKGDYIGSLCTRLSDMTTGINALLFSPEGLTDEQLFEQNVIVDLSRLGSVENKSLLMGLLVLRLQEYRAAQTTSNSPLRHITVLEEAHQLLKRTSTEQQAESSNLLGRSVEMLTNSLAEMRASGECFIIADQAPSALDPAAVRNTNTKIVMRLPGAPDREMAGQAMHLSDEQIAELASLPDGVAAVYQNNWQEAVLVKIPRFDGAQTPFLHTPNEALLAEPDTTTFVDAIVRRELDGWLDQLEGDRNKAILSLDLPTHIRCRLLAYNQDSSEGPARLYALAKVAYDFFNASKSISASLACKSIAEWEELMIETLTPSIADYSREDTQILLTLLAREHALRDKRFINLYTCYVESLRPSMSDSLDTKVS